MRKPSYPFGLPDSLPFLFNGGEEGAIYDPSNLSSMYQDDAATTAVSAYGDPVGRIRDVRATESYSATYTSDFSAGVDGWANNANTVVAGNIDGIEGLDNWLRATISSAGGTTAFQRASAFTVGKRYRIVLSVYVPSGQTYVDGFRIYTGNTSGTLIYDGDGANGSVVDIDVTKYATGAVGTILRIYARDGSSDTINAAASGELIYVRAVTVSESNLNDAIQATSGSRSLWQSPDVISPDGTDDSLSSNISTLDLSSAWEVAITVNFPDAPATETIFTLSNALSSATEWVGIGVDGSNLPYITTNGKTSETGTALSAGQYIFRLRWDGTQFKLFVNGVLDITETPSAITWSGVDYIVLSAVLDATPQFSDADIYGFMLILRNLTDAEANTVDRYYSGISGASL